MSNNPIHVRVEPHIHDMIDGEVLALGIKGGRGLAGGKAEWVRRIVYEHFDQPLPKQSHYLPGVTVSRQAKGMKRGGPPQPVSAVKPVARKAIRPVDHAPTPGDVPGQVLIDGSEVNSPEPPARTLTDPATAKDVGAFLINAWDGRKASQWTQMPALIRAHFGTDFGLTDLACRARYRRAKDALKKTKENSHG